MRREFWLSVLFVVPLAMGLGARFSQADVPRRLPEPVEQAEEAEEAAPAPEVAAYFGEEFQVGETMSVSEAITRGEELAGQDVTIQGSVADVCQRAGCWAVLAEGDQTIRILARGHGYAMPSDAAGSTFVVRGTLKREVVADDWIQHFAEESENVEAMPERSGVAVVSIDAQGVAMLAGSESATEDASGAN